MRTSLIIIGVALLGLTGVWLALRDSHQGWPTPELAPRPVTAIPISSPTNISSATSFRLRPLAIAQESSTHQWTTGDGKAAEVIRQLAHNDLEFARMVAENDTIFRRQLVYRKQTMSATVKQAIQSGEPIRELLVPGLDGQEFRVEVRNMDLAVGGADGTLSGNILGKPDSMVTLAFRGGREAFTIVSTVENIFITAEPREPGEVVVKKVDPDKYGGLNRPCTVN